MLDVAFDAVGLKSTFEQALDCVTVGGRLVSVGMSAESPSVGPTSMFGLTQKHVLGHLGYQNVDIETLAICCPGGGWICPAPSATSFPSKMSESASRSWNARRATRSGSW